MMWALFLADTLAGTDGGITLIINLEGPFSNTIFEQIFETLLIAIFILVLYTIGVYLIVKKIANEGSRFTAARIFTAILPGLGFLLGMMEWVQDPGQIFLFIGIICGALLIALRDLIQNVAGRLSLLVTQEFSIGDKIQIKGIYGMVMDIGVFRTTLIQLDEQSWDHPSGKITSIPNGILFRETVTKLTGELSSRPTSYGSRSRFLRISLQYGNCSLRSCRTIPARSSSRYWRRSRRSGTENTSRILIRSRPSPRISTDTRSS
jgi:small-conductance mechanosensitive channel